MFLAAAVIAILLALVYFTTGVQKLLGTKLAMQMGEHLGVSPSLGKVIGVLEVSAGVGLLAGLAVWPLGAAASVGVVMLMIGAIVFHVRAGDQAAQIVPPAVLGLLAVAEVFLRIATS